jgi:hypothetical protein
MTAKGTGEHLLSFKGFSPEVGTICSSEVLLTIYQTVNNRILELMLLSGSKHHSPVAA